MTSDFAQSLLTEFDTKLSTYKGLLLSAERILADVLRAANLRVLSVTGRVKDRASLEEKLMRPGKHYDNLQQVTDIVGLRVVTYFEDDVDSVARVIDQEFAPILEHCSDKRYFVEPDRFGYRSLHYVCKLSEKRRGLTEHANHREEMFEVQIRSILQHAWAEIEHDLGYKSPGTIPNEIRHQLSRVAGLLEIADRDFKEVRDKTAEYIAQVAKEIRNNSLSNIELNAISYLEFIAASPIVRELDDYLRDTLRYEFSQDADEDYIVESLKWVGVASIGQLQSKMEEHLLLLKAFESAVLDNPTQRAFGPVGPAIAVFFLAQILAFKDGGVDRLESFYKDLQITGGKSSRESAQETADLIERLETELNPAIQESAMAQPDHNRL